MNDPAEDLERFLDGCLRREEVAIVVAELHPTQSELSYGNETTIGLGPVDLTVVSKPMPSDVSPRLATGLSGPDKDLALRIKNMQPSPRWMQVTSMNSATPGEVRPLLIDSVEVPLAHLWIPTNEQQRWYLLPPGCDWSSVLKWIAHEAVPVFAPTAIYRERPTDALPPEFRTPAEEKARTGIEKLEQKFSATREKLQEELEAATSAADMIRAPLLFGRDDDLKKAVASLLRECGFAVEDLDGLGDTWSADLLVELKQGRWLVEVTSSSGSLAEVEWGKLKGHMSLWPSQRPDQPLSGGVLIVNNNRAELPMNRPAPYTRPMFVDALDGPVIGTVSLFSVVARLRL